MAFGMNYGNNQMAGMLLVPVTNEQQVNTYLVGAGQTVCLADFTNQMMWLKSTAANGIPQAVRKFKLEEIIEQPAVPAADGVSRAEFDELKTMLSQLINNQSQPTGGKE